MIDSTSRKATLTGWLRLFVVVALTLIAVLIIFNRTVTAEAMAVMPWICCAFICYLAPVFVSARTDLFSPPGIMGLTGGLATAAMLAMIARDGGVMFRPLGYMFSQQRIELARGAATLIIVAQLSYLVGYYRTSGAFFARLLPPVGERQWHGGRLLLAVILTGMLVVPIYLMFQHEMGGSALDVTNLGRGKEVIQEDASRSWMVRGIMFAFVPTLLLACAAIIDKSRPLLLVSAIVFIIVSILVTRLGPRRPAFLAGMMILILFHFLWHRIRFSVVVALMIVAVGVVNTLGDYRTTGHAKVELSDRLSNPSGSMARHEQDRNRLNVLGVILHYFPDRQDFLMGKSYAALPFFWVPRWIWPEKSQYFEWRGNRIVRQLVGLPAPPPSYAEMYANFSWFGVVIGMALFGAFHRGLARYRENHPRDAGVVLLYTVIVTTFSPTLLGVSAVLQYAVPITVLIYAVSRPKTATLPRGTSAPSHA